MRKRICNVLDMIVYMGIGGQGVLLLHLRSLGIYERWVAVFI